MDRLAVHSGGSFRNETVVGCLVTGGGGGGIANLGGLCTGGCTGSVSTWPLLTKGFSTYSFVARSDSGLGAASVTGGGGRKGAKGAVSGAGTLIMGARGRCARGGDVGPPWFAMWASLTAEPGSTLVRHRRQLEQKLNK